ncbi:hypothetical protein WN48_09805 [Eufriesea mexicana]|uniref:Uncharacterized protein n=1 Tax=Eufriesea mexicana TaxID=516756 RepID=A0A310S716_9HYME|nr:hypothetical protein WN48_09805 [Eufriesea mexicana]
MRDSSRRFVEYFIPRQNRFARLSISHPRNCSVALLSNAHILPEEFDEFTKVWEKADKNQTKNDIVGIEVSSFIDTLLLIFRLQGRSWLSAVVSSLSGLMMDDCCSCSAGLVESPVVVVAIDGVAGRRTTEKGRDAFRPGPASGLISKACLAGPALDIGRLLGVTGTCI